MDADTPAAPREAWRALQQRVPRRAVVAWLAGGVAAVGRDCRAHAQPAPGTAAPPAVITELRATLADALRRFEARDAAGVLAHVSDQYWTRPFDKRAIDLQLRAIFQLHDALRARVTLDAVRLAGPHAWVYSTGEVVGRVVFLGQWVTLYTWAGELEIARREGGAWRLYGTQQ